NRAPMTAAALGFGLAPWLGAALLRAGTWRWAFVVEVALGIVAFAVTAFARDDRQRSDGHVDFPGTILLASLLSCAVLAGTFAGTPTSGLLVLGLVAAALALVVCLVFVESHFPSPLFPPVLLGKPHQGARLLLSICFGFVGFAALISGPPHAAGHIAFTLP